MSDALPPRTVAEVILPGDPLCDQVILTALIARHDGCAPRVEPYRAELQDLAHVTGNRRLDAALQRAVVVDWRELIPTVRHAMDADAGAHDAMLASALTQALHDDALGSSGDPALEREYLRWSQRLPARWRPFPEVPPRARLLAALSLVGDVTQVRVDCPIVAEAQGALEAAAWDETLPSTLAARLADLLELLRTGWVTGAVVDIGPAAALGGILLDDVYLERLIRQEGPRVTERLERFAGRVPAHGAMGTRDELRRFMTEEERALADAMVSDRREWLGGLTPSLLELTPERWPATVAALADPGALR